MKDFNIKLSQEMMANIEKFGLICGAEKTLANTHPEDTLVHTMHEVNNIINKHTPDTRITRDNASEWGAIHVLFSLKKFLCNDGLNRVSFDNYLSALQYARRYIFNNYYEHELDCLGKKAIVIGDGADIVNETIIYILNNFVGMDIFAPDGTGERTRKGELRTVWYNISSFISKFVYAQAHTNTRKPANIEYNGEIIALGLTSNVTSESDIDYRINIIKNLKLAPKQYEYAIKHYVYGYGAKAIASQVQRDVKTIKESLESIKRVFIKQYASMIAEHGIDISDYIK